MYSEQTLAQFIVTSKIAGYATAGEGGEIDRSDFAKELTYQEGDFRYVDRYFGFNPFSGIETVWHCGTPVWGMTYYGAINPDRPVSFDIHFF